MSISFNHPLDTVTSTAGNGSLKLIVLGGTPTNPKPIRLDSSSVIMPVKDLPTGEAGAVVFDRATLTLKYHNGTNWVELLSATEVVEPVNQQIIQILNKLNSKVESVTYSSSSIPQASISGTNLNIVFPLPSSSQGSTGLYTSAKPGSIMHYSLSSGQGVASIREQMSGQSNGQAGRNGTSGAPWITSDGWCFADGQWWTWQGEAGTITKQVPNLNQEAYLKGISTSGITKTDSVIAGGGTLSNFTFAFPNHYHGTGQMGSLYGDGRDDYYPIIGRTWYDGYQYQGVMTNGEQEYRKVMNVNGNDPQIATSTTMAIYPNGTETTITHNHNLTGIDVAHFNVAVLYNISEPSVALSEKVANQRYVLKTGDTMSGTLSIANSASISGDGTNLQLFYRTSGGGERAAIYHQSSTSTLRLRSNGGAEVSISNTGALTVPSTATITGNTIVQGKNVVRSVNGVTANTSGEITLPSAGVQDIRQTGIMYLPAHKDSGNNIAGAGACVIGAQVNGEWDNNEQLIYTWLQKLINGVWITIGRE